VAGSFEHGNEHSSFIQGQESSHDV